MIVISFANLPFQEQQATIEASDEYTLKSEAYNKFETGSIPGQIIHIISNELAIEWSDIE